MFYSYNQILHIKQELTHMIPIFEARGLPVYEKGKHFSEYVKEYDKVLDEIGTDGVCTDADLCRGFLETEKLLQNIKKYI